jgi:hypothetical protein
MTLLASAPSTSPWISTSSNVAASVTSEKARMSSRSASTSRG